MISLIIPTYNEAENIKKLIPLLNASLKKTKQKYEIIIVDDNSPDETWKVASAFKNNVKVIRRMRERGLSSAVIEGFKKAKGDILGVMDADLSHPPTLVVEMAKQCATQDVVVASRYIERKKTGFTLFRKLVSNTATLLARPLTKVKDPMSGFFFLKRRVIEKGKLTPTGYKILLEILVKGNYDRKKVKEVPFVFGKRFAGKSKLGVRVIFDYLRHLAVLYIYKIVRD